jgi:hypothetical protein
LAVYIDPLTAYGHKRKRYSHMVADSEEELHAFAERMKLGRHWFHNSDHYDVSEDFYERAIAMGAILVTTRALVALKKK